MSKQLMDTITIQLVSTATNHFNFLTLFYAHHVNIQFITTVWKSTEEQEKQLVHYAEYSSKKKVKSIAHPTIRTDELTFNNFNNF